MTGADCLRELGGREGIPLRRRDAIDTEPLVDSPFDTALLIFCGVIVVASLIKDALDAARGLWTIVGVAAAEDLRETRDGASEGGRFVVRDIP